MIARVCVCVGGGGFGTRDRRSSGRAESGEIERRIAKRGSEVFRNSCRPSERYGETFQTRLLYSLSGFGESREHELSNGIGFSNPFCAAVLHRPSLMESHLHGVDKGSSKGTVLSAARTIDTCLTKDESFPDLEQLMFHSSASGDYRTLETSNFRKLYSLLLPPSLLEQLAGT